jgi:hypothetical protein
MEVRGDGEERERVVERVDGWISILVEVKVLSIWNKDHGRTLCFVVALSLLEQGLCFSLVLVVGRL